MLTNVAFARAHARHDRRLREPDLRRPSRILTLGFTRADLLAEVLWSRR
jgi:hypothetical protein